jgi:hypothetical protein
LPLSECVALVAKVRAHERAEERLNSVTGFPAPLRIPWFLTC